MVWRDIEVLIIRVCVVWIGGLAVLRGDVVCDCLKHDLLNLNISNLVSPITLPLRHRVSVYVQKYPHT